MDMKSIPLTRTPCLRILTVTASATVWRWPREQIRLTLLRSRLRWLPWIRLRSRSGRWPVGQIAEHWEALLILFRLRIGQRSQTFSAFMASTLRLSAELEPTARATLDLPSRFRLPERARA